MTPDLPASRPPGISSSVWISRLGLFTPSLLLGLLAATASPGAEDDQEPPPDPLTPPKETGFSQGGYFGGGSVPPSLLTPNRFRLGDFALSGQASLGLLYDDNVEADDVDRDEDVFLTFSPSVRAQSTYARHSIGFGAGASAGTALKDSTDDFFDWQVGADGRLDLSRTSKISASVSYSQDVEDDENVDAEDDEGDTPIHNISAGIGYNGGGDRLGFSVDGTVSRLDVEGDEFEDRDSTSYGLNGKLRLRWSENLTFSLGPSYRHSTFDQDVADDGDSREADRFGFQIGAGYRASRTITSSASLGYALLTFDDPDREDEDTATGSAGLTWAPGNGTTLNLGASRSLDISIEDGEDSSTRTTASATLAHRLKLGSRSALSSSLGFSVARLSDFDRTDKNLVAGLTFGYRLAERAVMTSSYRFSQRFSSDEDDEYYRNILSLGVTLSY